MRDRHIRLEENETTRRFHRTVSEAFKDAHYGAAVERPKPRKWGESLYWLLAFALFAAALSAPHWWPK